MGLLSDEGGEKLAGTVEMKSVHKAIVDKTLGDLGLDI